MKDFNILKLQNEEAYSKLESLFKDGIIDSNFDQIIDMKSKLFLFDRKWFDKINFLVQLIFLLCTYELLLSSLGFKWDLSWNCIFNEK